MGTSLLEKKVGGELCFRALDFEDELIFFLLPPPFRLFDDDIPLFPFPFLDDELVFIFDEDLLFNDFFDLFVFFFFRFDLLLEGLLVKAGVGVV